MWLKKKYFNLKGNFLHIGFEAGIILKGIDGILEILGGFLFVFGKYMERFFGKKGEKLKYLSENSTFLDGRA